MSLLRQREEKENMVRGLIGDVQDIEIHPIVGAEGGFGYRNKDGVSFSTRDTIQKKNRRNEKNWVLLVQMNLY